MNAGGWILMLASWTIIISLFIFCLTKVFSTHRNSDS